MKLSARNQFPGTIQEVRKGATTTHVRIEVAPGVVFTASITNESAEELGLAPGQRAVAVVKASDVMVGTES
ncbi:TOBE domain-containing protein [Paracraurococcus lichenis]|uniref:Molybdopterin-binding protein n=1 Tax=Paracraurococcus lichenis TaxID=3064888 RepID=A0ABT9E4N7_9PROT|nr:molybdopterin-binding protein [Paracraurococcus sp. LOR1-02]MDO9711123.1 molybdopterin-binding protein [Paracraurococcus sp. LOR1-02]